MTLSQSLSSSVVAVTIGHLFVKLLAGSPLIPLAMSLSLAPFSPLADPCAIIPLEFCTNPLFFSPP